MASAASINEVRAFNQRNLELNAWARSHEGVKQRTAMRIHEPVAPIRSATEEEILAIAEALDRGAILNPRMWVETFKVREAAEAVQFLKAA